MQKTNLIVDLSNIVWVTRHAKLKNKKEVAGLEKEILFHETFNLIKNTANLYKVDGIVVACDSPNVWRKNLYPAYKANRDKDRDEYYELVKEVLITLKDFFNECTSIPAIGVETAEADDVIAIITKHTSDKSIIMSTDKDFIQLITEQTKLYAPTLKKERETEDRHFDLFMKCIRGDNGDNIASAYPRVYEKKLREAWEDPYKMTNLMETKRKLDGKKVGDVYNFNRSLIDLEKIPSDVEDKILTEINKTKGTFSHLKTLQFFGKYRLKKLADEERKFAEIFKKNFEL